MAPGALASSGAPRLTRRSAPHAHGHVKFCRAYWTALAVADGLRRHVKALRPDWPSAEDRERDLEVHARVSEGLRSVHLPTGG